MSSVLVIITLIPLTLAVNYGTPNTCACQCIRHSPETYSERSDVRFESAYASVASRHTALKEYLRANSESQIGPKNG